MGRIIFGYHYYRKTWEIITHAHLIDDNIAAVPIIILVRYCHQFIGKQTVSVWCPRHRDYEEIGEFTEDGLITGAGCQLTGLLVEVEKNIYQTSWHYGEDSIVTPVRYTVTETEHGAYHITQENVHILLSWQKRHDSTSWGATGFLLVPNIMFIDKSCTLASPKANVPEAIQKHIFPNMSGRKTVKKKNAPPIEDEQAIRAEAEYYIPVNTTALDRPQWECNINGYNFRQIKYITMFQNISRHMEGRWYTQKELTDKILFAVERNGRYVALLVLSGNILESSIINTYNDHILTAKTRVVMLAWMQHNRIEEKYSSLTEDCRIPLSQPLHINAVTQYAPWEKMTLQQMLALPAEEVANAPLYYLNLNLKINTIILQRYQSPDFQEGETALLKERYPYIRHMFVAADNNNPEAQYVLHLMYSDAILFNYCDYRRADIWYQRAVSNGWLDLAPEKDDIKLTGFDFPLNNRI